MDGHAGHFGLFAFFFLLFLFVSWSSVLACSGPVSAFLLPLDSYPNLLALLLLLLLLLLPPIDDRDRLYVIITIITHVIILCVG